MLLDIIVIYCSGTHSTQGCPRRGGHRHRRREAQEDGNPHPDGLGARVRDIIIIISIIIIIIIIIMRSFSKMNKYRVKMTR